MFDRQRIIFWNDTKRELRSDFEQLVIPEVEKIEIRNNEFGTKYRVDIIRGEMFSDGLKTSY